MTKYTCVSIGPGRFAHTVERVAESAEAAAEAHAKAHHGAYYADAWRSGEDSRGAYQEFTIKAGSRAVSSVRVYAKYI